MTGEISPPSTTWFVGVSYGGRDDQLPRFLSEGIWENGYQDKHLELVKSMRPGERIAAKSSYTRKHGLPFDNRGLSVSVMAIRAVGTITENLNDGRRVKVKWTKVDPPREWYFYTHRGTVWRVQPGTWTTDSLIAFAFEGKAQDIDRFRNAPHWTERFGSGADETHRFPWTSFYEAVADKLIEFRENRTALVDGIREISSRIESLGYLGEDVLKDGAKGFVRDICPFTVMGTFNRGMTVANRKIIAAEIAKFLGVDEPVPAHFDGIPLLNNMKSWFFPREERREADHIDALWAIFDTALRFADSEDDELKDEFRSRFDIAMEKRGVGWNLTLGLYWIRPWKFLSLDSNSQLYLAKKLSLPVGLNGPKGRCSATDYLSLMETLEGRFAEESYPAHSYPELSLQAWTYQDPSTAVETAAKSKRASEVELDDDESTTDAVQTSAPIVPYSIDDILKEGCFLERAEIGRLLDVLRFKKNLILQGPPGTGKTWLARKLAFALVGERNESLVRAVQFHPNLSYEDFVRGWRPTGDGRLSLVDGVLMEAVKAAARNTSSRYVVVIEEINRGNPAQIFGEMLTLLEAGKRTPTEAIELCYPDPDGIRRPVHIPENLYIIGTMNIADRSLALVDLALRRRFAFVDLEPKLGARWRSFVEQKCGVDASSAADIEQRINDLNSAIVADSRLGKQFRVGHSYVTPAYSLESGACRQWFRDVVETEISPLLEEYWFDSPGEARRACEKLLQGW